MAAAHLFEAAHEHRVRGLQEDQPRRVAAAVEILDHRAEVGGERPAAHVHHDRHAGDLAAGACAEVDHRGDQLRAAGCRRRTSPMSSRTFAAVLRPAPDRPLTRATSMPAPFALRGDLRRRSRAGPPAERGHHSRGGGTARSPGTAAISSTLAALSLRTDPKCLSSARGARGPTRARRPARRWSCPPSGVGGDR